MTRATESLAGYIVMLSANSLCYLTRGEGDPPRTTKRKFAQRYTTENGARIALGRARGRYGRPWPNAEIQRTDAAGRVKERLPGGATTKRQRNTDCQRARHEAGLCRTCGGERLARSTRCGECLDFYNDQSRVRYADRRAQGLCGAGCGQASKRAICADCAGKRARQARARKDGRADR